VAPVRLEQGLGGWEIHPNGTHVTHVRSLTDRQQASGDCAKEIVQHLKSVRSKSHFPLLISRFRLRSIVAKIFDL